MRPQGQQALGEWDVVDRDRIAVLVRHLRWHRGWRWMQSFDAS
jgi:hypothetical protein